jgi:hypothetical protein
VEVPRLFRDVRSLLICAVFLLLSSCLIECYCLMHYGGLAGRPLYPAWCSAFLEIEIEATCCKHSESILAF